MEIFHRFFAAWCHGRKEKQRSSHTAVESNKLMRKFCEILCVCHNLRSALEKLTWRWKIHHLKMYFLLNMGFSNCHVSFREYYSWEGGEQPKPKLHLDGKKDCTPRQGNSEHSRHWFFGGKVVIDGEDGGPLVFFFGSHGELGR